MLVMLTCPATAIVNPFPSVVPHLGTRVSYGTLEAEPPHPRLAVRLDHDTTKPPRAAQRSGMKSRRSSLRSSNHMLLYSPCRGGTSSDQSHASGDEA